MRKIVNPFYNKRPVTSVENFYGREDMIKDIYFSFINLDPPNCLSLVGSRGIGKSSVINMVVAPEIRNLFLKGDKTLLVRIDFEDEELSNSLGFYKYIFKSINYEIQNDMFNSKSEKEHSQASYDRIYGEKEVEIVKDKLLNMLVWLKKSGYKTMLILDNFEKVLKETELTKVDFSFLRSAADASQFNIGYIIATTNNLEAVSSDIIASGLKNLFDPMKIKPFNDEQMDSYIKTPFNEKGVILEEHYCEWIKRASGGVPSILRTACERIFDRKIKNEDYYSYEEFLQELTAGCRPLFGSIWKSIDKGVKKACRDVALGKKVNESFYIRSGIDSDILFDKGKNQFEFLSDAFMQFVVETEFTEEAINNTDSIAGEGTKSLAIKDSGDAVLYDPDNDSRGMEGMLYKGMIEMGRTLGNAVGKALSVHYEQILEKIEETSVKTSIETAELVGNEVNEKLDSVGKKLETMGEGIEERFAGFEEQLAAVRKLFNTENDSHEEAVDYANEVRTMFISKVQNKDAENIGTIKGSLLYKEWDKVNDESKQFLILGEMLNEMFKTAGIDKNFISICYCCVLENEVNRHLVGPIREEFPDTQIDISGKKHRLGSYKKGLALGQTAYMLNDRGNQYYNNILLKMKSRKINLSKLIEVLKELTEIRNDTAHSNRKIVQEDIDKLRKYILGIGKEQSILESIFGFN